MTKVTVSCPQCQSRYQVDESQLGKRAHCKNCDTRFVLSAPEIELDTPVDQPAPSQPSPPQRAATDPGKAISSEYERRAQTVMPKTPPEEKKVAENSSYRNTKIQELTELCELAKEACDKKGNSTASAHVGTIQGGTMIILGGWSGIRPMAEGNPMLAMHMIAVTLVFNTVWKILKGAIRLWGLSDASGDYSSDTKLDEELAAGAVMVTTMMQKWNLM